MSLRYLQHLEELGEAFDPAAVVRLAAVLQMTYDELLHGRTDLPPGQPPPGPHPTLMKLTPDECWDRLSDHGIGRVALSSESGPAILPVNYLVDAHSVVYRTSRGGAAAAAEGSEVAFETDHLDETDSKGWSVLVVGKAEGIDEDTERRLAAQPGAQPWAAGIRDLWIRITPTRITGRLIGST
ncbi:pyridoxamine 5'-phosphate oxidase family protein [Kitasatospora sp. NBC_00240]|uniref:pyridoxamine 5'-phosphate oxidase family protein n=1 Tax=Kitasatospora sp. NBC_00240 TaxID=2903567 RepID=UPI00224D982A|nr:pyridoxamine 5'-phosphate oxidase family protein [Kitasatospora sp. NBC_00240]MCX5208233.1 pyridoxamine 5'-phosphate oxidase family protein [Kitasatospora sp. NBC_00240]